jgi:hypothetical protein
MDPTATEFENRVQAVILALTSAVAEALERKRRLGQYAIIEREGKPYHLKPQEMIEESKDN